MKAFGLGLFLALVIPPFSLAADPAATHGMFLFGKKNLYVSHLPMYSMPVHRYQVIMKVTIPEIARKKLDASKDEHAKELPYYTIDPETFVLPEKVSKKEPFVADIYRGHFEQLEEEPGGKPVRELVDGEVTFTIEDVLVFEPLKTPPPRPLAFTGYLFGERGEAFLVHKLTTRPNFDQIVALADVGEALGSKLKTSKPLEVSAVGPKDKEKLPNGVVSLNLEGMPKVKATSLYLEIKELQ